MKLDRSLRNQFGKRIREARETKGLSRKELADILGSTVEGTIENWESGALPSVHKLIKMIQILEIDPKYLFEPFIGVEDPELSLILERVRRIWELKENREPLDLQLEILERNIKKMKVPKRKRVGGRDSAE